MTAAEVIGAGVGTRIVDVCTAIERHSSFVLVEAPESIQTDSNTVATEFVLRALSTGTSSRNYSVLVFLKNGDVSFKTLCDHMHLEHAAVWEVVNDLIQVGLVGRALEHDRTGLTAAGKELLAFVELASQAAQNVAERGRQ